MIFISMQFNFEPGEINAGILIYLKVVNSFTFQWKNTQQQRQWRHIDGKPDNSFID